MDNRRWVIALDKRTGKRMEFTMCDLNNVAFYRSKYTLDGYDVKVLTADVCCISAFELSFARYGDS